MTKIKNALMFMLLPLIMILALITEAERTKTEDKKDQIVVEVLFVILVVSSIVFFIILANWNF